jgi:hypothetical protein
MKMAKLITSIVAFKLIHMRLKIDHKNLHEISQINKSKTRNYTHFKTH